MALLRAFIGRHKDRDGYELTQAAHEIFGVHQDLWYPLHVYLGSGNLKMVCCYITLVS